MINAYTLMLGGVILLGFLLRGDLKGNKKYIIVAGLLMALIFCCRDTYVIGNDSRSSYLHAFQRLEDMEWSEIAAPLDYNAGFYYLMKLVSILTDGDYQAFITLISAFEMFVFLRLVYKYSPSPMQSFVYYCGLMYFTFHISALKQSVAMTFVMLAFDAIVEKKPIKFVLLTLLGAWFHFPALIFLPAYIIGRMNTGKGNLILLAAVLALTYFFRDDLLNIMMDAYKGSGESDLTLEGARFLTNKVIIMLIIVVAALVLRPPTVEDRLYCTLIVLMGIAIVFQTFSPYNNIFERLADYYFQFSAIFIPMVFERCELKKHWLSERLEYAAKSVAPWVFCAFGVWRFATTIQGNGEFLPYRFFFQ